MPVDINALRNNSKNIRIQFAGDGDLNVTVYPHRLNQSVIDRYADAARDKDYDLAAEIFREVVTEWDLQADGETMPINGETFQFVGAGIMNEIWDRISDAVTPKSQKRSGR